MPLIERCADRRGMPPYRACIPSKTPLRQPAECVPPSGDRSRTTLSIVPGRLATMGIGLGGALLQV
ncbi:MAG: hypothetical protein K0U78_13765 [Actinomycetia bacterium]|nr:hypothetical protein [Actinomycetes bacterium]